MFQTELKHVRSFVRSFSSALLPVIFLLAILNSPHVLLLLNVGVLWICVLQFLLCAFNSFSVLEVLWSPKWRCKISSVMRNGNFLEKNWSPCFPDDFLLFPLTNFSKLQKFPITVLWCPWLQEVSISQAVSSSMQQQHLEMQPIFISNG